VCLLTVAWNREFNWRSSWIRLILTCNRLIFEWDPKI
jgi:hypothetical protein